jgi:hypothetical protein
MQRRDSAIGLLGFTTDKKGKGAKNKPGVYTRVRNLSIIAVENLGALRENAGKKGKKKKLRLNEGGLYEAPTEETNQVLMKGMVQPGIRLKNPN